MPSEEAKVRVMLFIDFWNFTLNMKKLDETFLIDWFKNPLRIYDASSKQPD